MASRDDHARHENFRGGPGIHHSAPSTPFLGRRAEHSGTEERQRKGEKSHPSTVTPSFLLRGVDSRKMLEMYMNSTTLLLEPRADIIIERNKISVAPTYSSDVRESSYTIRDRNGAVLAYTVTGYNDEILFVGNGLHPHEGDHTCKSCLDKFRHPYLGRPIKHVEYYMTVTSRGESSTAGQRSGNANHGEDVNRTTHCFWTEWKFCTFECLYYYNGETLAKSGGNSLGEIDVNINTLFSLMYPGEVLASSENPLLLASNGGTMTREQWLKSSHTYKSTWNVVNFPAKEEYMIKRAFVPPSSRGGDGISHMPEHSYT